MNSFRHIKEALCCLLLFFLFIRLLAQKKEANNWYWGYKAGLTFNYTPPRALLDSKIFTDWSNASISDSAGRLLFYTDTDSLYRNNAGTILIRYKIGIEPGYKQASLIIPDSKNGKKYWVAVVSSSEKPGRKNVLKTFTVDMNLDNGKGNLDTTTIKQVDTLMSSTVSVMQHADGIRNWLIGRHFGTDTLLAWLVDTAVHPVPVASKIFSPYQYPHYTVAQVCKTSPNSEILFWGWGQRETRCNQLVKVNRTTGEFSGIIHLVDSVSLKPKNVDYIFPVDAAFSPDSRYLYTVENSYKFNIDSTPVPVHQQNRIYYTVRQYDLSVWDSAAIKNSGRVVFQSAPFIISGANGLGPMTCQLGPDGKIYFLEFNQTRLSVMHCPGSPAPNVNFKFHEINLQRKGGFRMPTLNQTFVRNAGIFQVQANKRKLCQGDTLEISGYGAGAEHFTWSVSPALPASVKVDTLTWQKISTATIPAGSYTFTCKSFSRCGDVFEKSLQIEILPLPQLPNLIIQQKPVPCKGDSVIIQVQNLQSGSRYFWSTGDSTSSIVVKQTGLVSLDSVSNAVGCGVRVGDTVAVTIKNAPIPLVPVILGPKVVEICEGHSATLKVETQNAKVVWSNGQVGDSISVGSGQFTVYSESVEGCRSGWSDTVLVVAVPLPTVQIVAMDSVRCEANEEEKEYKLISQNVEVKSFEIQGGVIVSEGDSSVRVKWYAEEVKSQNVKIKSFNRIGCEGSVVTFRPKSDLEVCRSLYPLGIPNLVTLNGDERNDLWELANLFYYQPVSLHIYNRWGKLIFETNDYRNNWPEDGLEPGTYFYRMGVSGEGNSNTGWIEVVK